MALKGSQSLPITLRLTARLKDHTGTLGRCCGKHVDQRKAPIENGVNTSFMFFGPTASQSEKDLGVHPFFLVTGAHPVLPFDIVEATWLVKLPDRVLTTEELIGYRARALAKHRDTVEEMRARVSKNKRDAMRNFERQHSAKIKDYIFKPGDLVLMRNSPIE